MEINSKIIPTRDEDIRAFARHNLGLCGDCLNRLTKEELTFILKNRGHKSEEGNPIQEKVFSALTTEGCGKEYYLEKDSIGKTVCQKNWLCPKCKSLQIKEVNKQ